MSKTKPSAAPSRPLPLGTTAARSVFEVGRQAASAAASAAAKPKADEAQRPSGYQGPIDVDKVTIHSDIPLPPARNERTSANFKLLQRMQPGQAVFLPRVNANSLLAMGKKAGIALARRDMSGNPKAVAEAGPDAVGVWRLK